MVSLKIVVISINKNYKVSTYANRVIQKQAHTLFEGTLYSINGFTGSFFSIRNNGLWLLYKIVYLFACFNILKNHVILKHQVRKYKKHVNVVKYFFLYFFSSFLFHNAISNDKRTQNCHWRALCVPTM